MRNKRVFIFLLSLVVLVSAVAAFAQGGANGAITGRVTDPNGAVIVGAEVTITNQDTGVTERTIKSGSQGTFSATLLPVGTYRVEVTATGFNKAATPDTPVRVSETSFVAVQLTLGKVTEAVGVTTTGGVAIVEVTNATTGEALSGDVIREMPLATRNFLGLLALSAGTNSEFADTTALGRGQTTIIVNGQRPVNNNYQLEGINANDVSLPVFDNVNLPNPDVVEDFKTQTSLYDASQGRNGGGNMQVNLRSGTSQYHGDAFEYFRNSVLDANDPFLKGSQLAAGEPNTAPVLRQNAFGASVGGPVPGIKDFFFFGNYSGVREASAIAAGTVINTDLPVLPADRSAANLMSVFGVSKIDPVALAWLNLPASKCPGFNDGVHCIPTIPGIPGETLVNGVLTTTLGPLNLSSLGVFHDNQYTITADKKIGSKDTFTARWFFDDSTADRPFGENATLPFAENNPLSNRFLKLGLTHVFSSTMVNEFRFGYARFNFQLLPSEPVSLSDIDSTRPNSADFAGAWQPSITGGGFSIGVGANDNRGTRDNTFVWGDDLSKTIGKHTLRFGGEVDRWQLNRFNHYEKRGVVTYAADAAAFPGLNGFQNFLEGNVNGTAGEAGIDTFYFRATDAGAYVQDDWKVTPRLMLNLGIRWEGIDTAHVKGNFLTNLGGIADCSSTGCASDGLAAPPLQYIHPAGAPGGFGTPGVSDCTEFNCFSDKNFAPRVGFAWDIFGDQKTALRGGYGMYYQRVSNQAELQSAGGPPFNVTFEATPGQVTPENPFPQLLPNSNFPLPLTPCTPGVCTGNTLGPAAFGIPSGFPQLSGFGPNGAPSFDNTFGNSSNLPNSQFFFFPVRNFLPPYAQQWNLTLQREVAPGWMVEVGYVGSAGDRLLGPGRAPNGGQICTLKTPCVIPKSALSPTFTAPAAGTADVQMNSDGSVSITGSTAANVNARVFLPFLGTQSPFSFLQENNSHSSYHSLQATLIHQFAKGLYFQAAYTWSKSIDNASGSEVGDELNGLTQFGDLLNINSNRGLSDFDRPHRLVFTYSYALPFGTEHGVSKLVHGWTVQGTTTLQSGTPFTIYDSSALSASDPLGVDGTNFATLAPGMSLSSVLNTGSTAAKIQNYVNLSSFLTGGACVNDQNQIITPIISSTSKSCAPNADGTPNSVTGGTGLAALGNVGRNSFRGPFQQEWDFSVHKITKITERFSFLFGADFFNVFNHPSYASPQSGPQSPYATFTGGSNGNYGAINLSTGASNIYDLVNRPRIVQFVGKVSF